MRTYLANEVLKFGEFDDAGISERPLLIRCDKDVDFKYIQKIMQICVTSSPGTFTYIQHNTNTNRSATPFLRQKYI